MVNQNMGGDARVPTAINHLQLVHQHQVDSVVRLGDRNDPVG